MARLPDTATHRFRITIPSSNGKKEYTVSQRITTKVWECSCTGWIAHRHCKHLKSTEEARMKLAKAFGANNKDRNGPPGNPDAWNNAFESAIPEAPEAKIETVQITGRKFKIKEIKDESKND